MGNYRARSQSQLRDYLEHLGSRLVFLIDWNRARRQLSQLVNKRTAIELLEIAARERYGHMGWLLAGGARLIFDAMQQFDAGLFRIGDRLDEVLGEETAKALLSEVMQKASDSWARGEQASVVADETRLLLARAVRRRSVEFDTLCEQAALAEAIADSLDRALTDWLGGEGTATIETAAQRAKQWERRADDQLVALRNRTPRRARADAFVDIVLMCDDVADNLEEAHFLLALFGHGGLRIPPAVAPDLGALVRVTLAAVQDWVRVVHLARLNHQIDDAATQERILQRLWQLLNAERQADALLREVRRLVIQDPEPDPRALALTVELAGAVERATDVLLIAGHTLRRTLVLSGEKRL